MILAQPFPESENRTGNSNANDADGLTQQMAADREAFEKAIGRMIVWFAHLEGTLITWVCSLAIRNNHDRRPTMSLLSGLSFRQLLPRLSAQVRFIVPEPSEHLERIDGWITRAGKAADSRNRFVHHQLVFRSSLTNEGQLEWSFFQSRTTIKRGFEAKAELTTVEDIDGLSSEIETLNWELMETMDGLIAAGFVPVTARYSLLPIEDSANRPEPGSPIPPLTI